MTLITIEAINAAKASLMALYDAHLPSWDASTRRLNFIDATEQVFESLDVALASVTTPEALGCIIPESEDGTSAATRHG